LVTGRRIWYQVINTKPPWIEDYREIGSCSE
jgi:hypothetical protein